MALTNYVMEKYTTSSLQNRKNHDCQGSVGARDRLKNQAGKD